MTLSQALSAQLSTFFVMQLTATSLQELHPAIQDPSFTSRQCLQERVGKDKQSISVRAKALHQSEGFKVVLT